MVFGIENDGIGDEDIDFGPKFVVFKGIFDCWLLLKEKYDAWLGVEVNGKFVVGFELYSWPDSLSDRKSKLGDDLKSVIKELSDKLWEFEFLKMFFFRKSLHYSMSCFSHFVF